MCSLSMLLLTSGNFDYLCILSLFFVSSIPDVKFRIASILDYLNPKKKKIKKIEKYTPAQIRTSFFFIDFHWIYTFLSSTFHHANVCAHFYFRFFIQFFFSKRLNCSNINEWNQLLLQHFLNFWKERVESWRVRSCAMKNCLPMSCWFHEKRTCLNKNVQFLVVCPMLFT